MSKPSQTPQPDYERCALVFDRYLPFVQPVSLAVLDRLPVLSNGARVLDVACGTGEPGLTLARRLPDVELLGVDAAAGMVEVARAKAARENLPNARFEVIRAEALDFPDASMDAVLSRFGLLMFGDVEAMAREVGRVLRPGSPFSLAVWDDMSRNTLVGVLFAALRPRVADVAAGVSLHRRAVPGELGLRDIARIKWLFHTKCGRATKPGQSHKFIAVGATKLSGLTDSISTGRKLE